jgi:hypothetical protein
VTDNPTAEARRLHAPSGNRDNDYWQAECSCGWTSSAVHSNRTVEGRALADRDAADHMAARHLRHGERA